MSLDTLRKEQNTMIDKITIIDQITRQQFEDEVYLICGEDRRTASRIMMVFDTLRGEPRALAVTEEQLKQIKRKFWGSSDDVLGNDMIEIDEAYGIVCECIGYEEE